MNNQSGPHTKCEGPFLCGVPMYWTGLKTLVLRECGVVFQFWSVTLAPPVVTTVLYFAIFGEIVGLDYIRFLAPGLVVLWVIPYSYGHTAAGFLGARHFKYVEELLVSPLPDRIIVAGYVIGGMVRGLVVAIAVVMLALVFTEVTFHSALVSVAALVLAALVASAGGFITATMAKSFEQVTTIEIAILTPLTYLGGVFAPLSSLPEWAQKLSLANPMFYMVDAFRYGLLGVSEVPVGFALGVLSTFAGILVFVALRRMGRASRI
jgi:ABC-2 type transport system permease protein